MVKTSDKSTLTKNFTYKEYAYGIFKSEMAQYNEETQITVNALKHAEILQEFREWLNKPMTVNCWYRAPKFNKAKGGEQNSGHLSGTATDVSMKITPIAFTQYKLKWFELCKKHGCVGAIGYYPQDNFVHFESYVTWSKVNTYWKKDKGKMVYNF